MKTKRLWLAFALVGILLVVGAAQAFALGKWNTIGSGWTQANGEVASVAIDAVTDPSPEKMRFVVKSTHDTNVTVSLTWDIECFKGLSFGGKSGNVFNAKIKDGTNWEKIVKNMPLENADYCVGHISATQDEKKGTLTGKVQVKFG